ncbi:MAG: hypothetical protein AAF383_27065, partial [Cyanobacteria bacterium P01_A01_bin.83]
MAKTFIGNLKRRINLEVSTASLPRLSCLGRLFYSIPVSQEKPLTDEQIAAATNQPEWKVRLWRHGQQKPRGKRIKKNLEP